MEKITILGVPIDSVTLAEAGERTKELIEESNKTCKMIFAPNTEFIIKANGDKEFFDILKQSDLSTPDSVGVELGAKLQGKAFKQRIPGQSYFREILRLGLKENWTFYLLGGEEAVIREARENIIKMYPSIKIVGTHNGFFNSEEEKKMIQEINELQPNVLFVALGAPRQEKWIYNHRHELKVDVAAGQGGTFDFEAGKLKRAPITIQKIGLEWLWRLIQEPWRIVRMMALPAFLFKIIISKDKTKGAFDE